MRWDELFADLEGQLEAGIGAEEREAEIEEQRLALGRLSIRDRVTAIARERDPLRVRLCDGSVVALVPRTVGRDWIAGDLHGTAAQVVVPLHAIAALLPTAEQRGRSFQPQPPGALTDRLGLPFLLRDLARRRRGVELLLRSSSATGTIDRVGRDHLDLAVHPLDEWRRERAVARVEVVALADLVLLRVD